MNCERCGKSDAIFLGVHSDSGPSALETDNTPENLPGGYGWLCISCLEWVDSRAAICVKCHKEVTIPVWFFIGSYKCECTSVKTVDLFYKKDALPKHWQVNEDREFEITWSNDLEDKDGD